MIDKASLTIRERPEILPPRKIYTDIHVHGVPLQGVPRVHGWRRILFELFARQTGARSTGPEAVGVYRDSLVHHLRYSLHVRRAVILALDRAYDSRGTPIEGRSHFTVSNDDVLSWCRAYPDVFLFGASIHPHRRDALDALEHCARQDAVLIKWLPNHQGIDPAARRHVQYYRKLVELGLPLLCHCGYEFALPAFDQRLGRLERLFLPLEQGVTVIAAHSGSAGIFFNHASMERFALALRRFPNLYGETAALALPNRMGALLWWRHHLDLSDRLLFGTDFPVQIWNPLWRLFVNRRAYARFAGERNPFDRMVTLLKGLNIRPPEDGFEVLLRKAGRPLS